MAEIGFASKQRLRENSEAFIFNEWTFEFEEILVFSLPSHFTTQHCQDLLNSVIKNICGMIKAMWKTIVAIIAYG